MENNEIVELYKKCGSMSQICRELKISFSKVRKTLLTNNIELESEKTKRINELYNDGMNVLNISKYLGIRANTVTSHLPYIKVEYCKGDKSDNAKRIDKCRGKIVP